LEVVDPVIPTPGGPGEESQERGGGEMEEQVL